MTCGLSVVEVIGVHAKVFQHVVGNRSVDVLAIQIERDEHHPCPQCDSEVKLFSSSVDAPGSWMCAYLANKLSLFFRRPRVVRIEPMSSLILGFVVDLSPILCCYTVAERMIVV